MTGQGTVSEPFGVKSNDLYVQEPLFTGASGTSAYIGWNNETVLWEGEINTTAQSAQLSEALSGFNSVKFYAHRLNNPIGRGIEVQEFVPTWTIDTNSCYFYCLWTDMASNTMYQNMMYISAKDDAISFLPGWRKEGATETTGITSYGFRLEKVVGVNRKV